MSIEEWKYAIKEKEETREENGLTHSYFNKRRSEKSAVKRGFVDINEYQRYKSYCKRNGEISVAEWRKTPKERNRKQ